MNMEEVKAHKQAAEMMIEKAINQFSMDTGLTVHRIDFITRSSRNMLTGDVVPCYYNAKMEVRL